MANNVLPSSELTYQSGEEDSDLTIKYPGKVLHVHQSVVCLQSKFFRDQVDALLKKNEPCVVELGADEADLDIIDTLFSCLYSRSLNKVHSAIIVIKLYLKGHKWNMGSLMVKAVARLESILSDSLRPMDEQSNSSSNESHIAVEVLDILEFVYGGSLPDDDKRLAGVILKRVLKNDTKRDVLQTLIGDEKFGAFIAENPTRGVEIIMDLFGTQFFLNLKRKQPSQ